MGPGGLSLGTGVLGRSILPVHTIGRASVKGAMWPDPTVERHVVHHPLVGVVDSLVGVE